MFIPARLFLLGSLVVVITLVRRENLDLKDAIMVMIGMRRYTESKLVNTLVFVTLLAPLGVWVLLNERCQAGLPAN